MDIEQRKKKWKQYLSKSENGNYWWKLRDRYLSCSGLFGYMFYAYKYHRYLQRMGAHIPIEATFASQPTLPHGIYGTFVSLGAVIGKKCVIFQQVTIGSNTIMGSKGIGSPTIGDEVYIGAGAKIIGNVKIGDHARIGANCVITQDVPPNTTVVMQQNRVIEHENILDNHFYWYDQVKDSIPDRRN